MGPANVVVSPRVSRSGGFEPQNFRRLEAGAHYACFRMTLMSYEGIITVEPGKRGGQPCIRGMRITVYDVLSYLASGMTEEQILADFPYLTRDDILACLSYAAEREHRMLVANE